MSIQPVSYATTKNGNPYKKTHAATMTGAAVGTAYGALSATALTKTKFGKAKMINLIKNARNQFMNCGIDKADALKLSKKNAKIGVALGVAFCVAAGLGIGALVNKGINKTRAKKADAEAV